MTDYVWPLVALVALVLAYRLLTQWIGNAPRADINALRQQYDEQRTIWVRSLGETNARLAEHVKTWDAIGIQWRAKVAELETKCDRVVVDAKNEIAGDLATVSNITNKGWR